MIESIESTDQFMLAHIAQINRDKDVLGRNLDDVINLLIEADPVVKKTSNLKKRNSVQVSTTLAGRGEIGVNFCWHPHIEFKKLTQEQKDELNAWRETPEEQEASKKSLEAVREKRKQKRQRRTSGGGGGGTNKGTGKASGGGGNNNGKPDYSKKSKAYKKAVRKEAGAVVKSAMKQAENEEKAERLQTEKIKSELRAEFEAKGAGVSGVSFEEKADSRLEKT